MDRRKFVRITRTGAVKFREMNLPKELFGDEETVYRNISAGGVYFESPRAIPKGAVLSLEIDMKGWASRIEKNGVASFDNSPLKILGEVIRCEEVAPSSAYSVGVKFMYLDSRYQKTLIEFLKEHFQAPSDN